jgi:hypothetical protein
MQFRTGYIYHWVSAVLFIGIGMYVFFNPSVLPGNSSSLKAGIAALLSIWGLFRGINGYLIYRRRSHEKE